MERAKDEDNSSEDVFRSYKQCLDKPACISHVNLQPVLKLARICTHPEGWVFWCLFGKMSERKSKASVGETLGEATERIAVPGLVVVRDKDEGSLGFEKLYPHV